MISVTKVVHIDKLDVIVQAKLFFSFLVVCCFLLAIPYFQPVARYFLFIARYFLHVARYFLLLDRYFMLDARCSMLENLTNKTRPQIFSLQISEISKFLWMVVFRVTNIASTDITLMSLLQYLDTLLSNLCTVEPRFFEHAIILIP